MNLKNMRKLRTHLRSRKNPMAFDMTTWFRHNKRRLKTATGICNAVEKHPCGTAACLAGHAALLAWQSGDVSKWHKNVDIENVAAEWLGLDYVVANELFMGRWPGEYKYLSDITKPQAIAELTRLIEAETT